MLIVLSPAKTLNYQTIPPTQSYSQPDYLKQAHQLVDILRTLSPQALAEMMHISDTLAMLNVTRFAAWHLPFTPDNSKQALFAFMGDVYEGLDAYKLSESALDYAQQHLRILSGLYGVLRPLDLIQAYRLEMGSKLINPKGRTLYAFWNNLISEALNQALQQINSTVVVNLASDEYFKAIKRPFLNARVVTPVFEDYKQGKYKVISFYSKRARGLMARYASENQLTEAESLKMFATEGYLFSPAVSDELRWVFRRKLI